MPYKRYMWEVTKFYLMKFWILLSYMDIRVRSMFGFKVNVEELQDFELDVIEAPNKI